MRNSSLLVLATLAAAGTACASRAASTPEVAAVDSLVLERKPCFGSCPAYRLSVGRGGIVRFQSRNRSDSSVAADTLDEKLLPRLVERALAIPLAALPDTVRKDPVLCKDYATDHPTIIVRLFGPEPKHVVYYTGCYTECCEHTRAGALKALADFATDIDSATGAGRWIRPNPYRFGRD